MLIQIMILECDIKGCDERLLITNTLQPLIEAINNGWEIVNPKTTRGETKHVCPECVKAE